MTGPSDRGPERHGPSSEALSPRTRALAALIDASLERLTAADRPRSALPDALLFIGNWNDALPRLLIHDPVLEPVDKIVWAVIKTCTDPSHGTAFPSYATIARLANVSAEATVARALAILRITRWMTLCGRARDGRGRFRGNVYVLHDEPLPLPDTLHLDVEYMAFVDLSQSHGHARVRVVASGVVGSLELDVAEDTDSDEASDATVSRIAAQQLIAQRLEEPLAVSTPSRSGPPTPRTRGSPFARSFSTRFEFLPPSAPAEAATAPPLPPLAPDETASPDHQLQNLKTVIPRLLQNLKTVQRPKNLRPQILRSTPPPCSSSSSETTTTDTVSTSSSLPQAPAGDTSTALSLYRWPAWLSRNHRHLALLELRKAPEPLRQTVLDLLDQRRQDGDAAAAEPLHHPIQYLRSLCRLAVAGRLKLPPDTTPSAPLKNADSPDDGRQRLANRLRVAESDHRHWLRLTELTSDPSRKAQWQAQADLVKEAIDQVRAELAQWDSAGNETRAT